MSAGPADDHWRRRLAEWAIPPHILAAADDSPWQVPPAAMVARTQRSPQSPSLDRAAEALDPEGTVLDVGAGAGAASLPIAVRITKLVAVDEDAGMLATLTALATQRGLAVDTVPGRWPDVAAGVDEADVVVCQHVFYNVPDLAAFATALHDHARRRVVIELTDRHPQSVHSPLWKELHGVDRPDGPTAADAIAVLRETGLEPRVQRWQRPHTHLGDEERLDMSRRALCLPRDRVPELTEALTRLAAPPKRDVVTLWWDRQPPT